MSGEPNGGRISRIVRRWIRRSVVLLLLHAGTYLGALDSPPVTFNHISLREGLSNNSAYCIHQDHLGFIWIGTFSGLNRYDGTRMEIFRPEPMDPDSISGSIIFDILEDSRNRLWIGTDGGGFNRYDFETNSFQSYHPEAENPFSISSQKIFSLEEDSFGRIWIGTADAGISIFSPETQRFTNLSAGNTAGLESDVIRTLLRDSRGRIWVGTQGGGLSVSTDGIHFFNYLEGSTVRELFEDSRNRIWIGLEGDGLLLVDESRSELAFRTRLPGQLIRSIAEDRNGRLWIGTERDGLVLLEENRPEQQIRNDRDNASTLSSDFIRDVFVDRSGLVWIATRGGGVNTYNSRSEGFGRMLPGAYAVRQIFEDSKSRLWIATDGQGLILNESDAGPAELRHVPGSGPGLSSNHLYALAEDTDGSVWIGSDGDGLDRYYPDTGEFRHYRYDPLEAGSLSSNVIWSLLRDSEGDVWIGTEGGGLNRFDRATGRFRVYQNSPDDEFSLLGNSVRALFEDSRSDLWIGTWDGGLSRKAKGDERFVNYTRDPLDRHSISDNSVNCITETADGLLWIGTSGGGINSFDPETETFTAYRVEDGLADNTVYGIVPDENGFLWISTANGLSRFDLITSQFTSLWDTDGLIANEFERNAFMKSSAGEVFFGTTEGIVRFFPDQVRLNSYMPQVLITDFSLFNRSVQQNERIRNRVYLKKDITLSDEVSVYPGDSFIGFTFSSLDFANPVKNKFAVRLAGFDSDWHYLGTRNRFFYSSLPPGDYRLQVMGTNSNGTWSTEFDELTLHVIPSFFQTWYFYLLLFLLIAAVFYAVARIRIAGLNRHNLLLQQFSNYVQDVREEERRSIARDVHDELGQLLTTMKMHIFWLSQNPSTGREQRQAKYDSTLGIINATLDWSKDLATRLRPVVLDNLSLAEAVNWLIDETEKHSSLPITRSIEDTPDMPVERATSIFRIVQETITNIIRHSGATAARVSLRCSSGFLFLSVEDNGRGIGRNQLSNPDSYGIIGMRERAKHLGGEITFTSDALGTRIDAKIPIEG